jgi:hypothetical protein
MALLAIPKNYIDSNNYKDLSAQKIRNKDQSNNI